MEDVSGNQRITANDSHIPGEAPICIFFVNGSCNRGFECSYSHSLQAKRPACKFFFSLQVSLCCPFFFLIFMLLRFSVGNHCVTWIKSLEVFVHFYFQFLCMIYVTKLCGHLKTRPTETLPCLESNLRAVLRGWQLLLLMYYHTLLSLLRHVGKKP